MIIGVKLGPHSFNLANAMALENVEKFTFSHFNTGNQIFFNVTSAVTPIYACRINNELFWDN